MSAPSGRPRDEALGSAAQEAARLAEALHGWWAERAPQGGPSPPGDGSHDPATCRYCPVCRALAVAQSVRPEVVEHLAHAAESFAAALLELARDVRATGADPERPRRPDPGTVRIPVDSDDCEGR